MRIYTPDLWSLLEITEIGEQKLYKVVASWYGGFGGSNSWKISSGVTEIIRYPEVIHFINFSGSVYLVGPNNYGMSSYTRSIVDGYMSEDMDGIIRVLTLEEALAVKI